MDDFDYICEQIGALTDTQAWAVHYFLSKGRIVYSANQVGPRGKLVDALVGEYSDDDIIKAIQIVKSRF